MRTRNIVIVSAATVVVALGATAFVAGPTLYRDLVVGPAAAAPTENLGVLKPSTLTGDQLAGSWKTGSSSYAGYRVKEVLNGTDVTVTGRTSKVDAAITTTSDTVKSAEISVDVASIATTEAARDEYFRTTAIDTSKFPKATFTIAEPLKIDPSSLAKSQTVQTKGSLSINGVTKEVTAPVTFALSGDGAILAGSVPITFADYSVTAPDLGFVKVEQKGSIEFSLDLQKSAAS